MMNINALFSKLLLTICITASLSACSVNPHQSSALSIAQQGNFAAGGKVIQSAGQFDDQQLFNPQGQTLHGDHASVFYQIPEHARAYPLVFYMVRDNQRKHGEPHLMVVRDSRHFSCANISLYMLSINHVGDRQDNRLWQRKCQPRPMIRHGSICFV